MSTKATRMHGKGFHLYEEMIAGELWLEFTGGDLAFVVSRNSVAVRLPNEFIKMMKWEPPKTRNPSVVHLKRASKLFKILRRPRNNAANE